MPIAVLNGLYAAGEALPDFELVGFNVVTLAPMNGSQAEMSKALYSRKCFTTMPMPQRKRQKKST